MHSLTYGQVGIGEKVGERQVRVACSEGVVFVLFWGDGDCEMVVVGVKQAKVLARAFFMAPVRDIVVKSDY